MPGLKTSNTEPKVVSITRTCIDTDMLFSIAARPVTRSEKPKEGSACIFARCHNPTELTAQETGKGARPFWL